MKYLKYTKTQIIPSFKVIFPSILHDKTIFNNNNFKLSIFLKLSSVTKVIIIKYISVINSNFIINSHLQFTSTFIRPIILIY